jgi:hypothetical protein
MKRFNALFFAACLALWAPATALFAHEGHGTEGPHWHAADAWMILALAAGVAIAIWLSKGKK